MANEKIRFDLTASDQTAAAFNAILGRLDSVDKSAKSTSKSFGDIGVSIKSAFAGVGAFAVTKEIIELADSFSQVSSRLKLVTDGSVTFANTQKELFKISQDTRVGFGETVDLYSRMARASQTVGVSQSDLLKVTDGINKALIVSGASGQSASAALIQLSQGMAAGALRGQELNSVMEQTPRITQALQKSLGVTEGGLRKLAEEGKLTSEVFIDAFLKALPELNAEFERMPVTVGQAMTMINNSILLTVGTIDQATGSSRALSRALQDVSFIIKAIGDPKNLDISLQSQLQKVEDQIKKANEGKSFLLNMLPSDSDLFQALQKQKLMVLQAEKDLLKSRMEMRGSRLEYELFGPERLPTPKVPVKTKEQEAAEKKLADFLRQQNDELIKIGQGERALAEEQAKRIGLSGQSLQNYMATYDKIAGIKKQQKQDEEELAEFDRATIRFLKDKEKSEQDLLKLNEKQVDAGDKALNYLEKYREDMDIILDQIQLKNDGVFRTAEQTLIENSRLQLTKKFNEEIVKIKNLDNLTEQGKINAIAAANLKYEQQLGLVKELAVERVKDREDMMKGATLGVATYLNEITNFAQFTEDATSRALRGMEDSLVRFVQTGKLSFKDMANSIIADLIRIQLRQSIMGPLGSLIPNLFNTSAPQQPGVVMGGPSYENGGYTGTGARSGGMDGKGGFMAMLHPNETVIDHTKGQGGGVTVVQNINVSTGVQQTVRSEIMTLMPQIAGAAKAAVAEAKMRGGGYAAAMR